MDNKAISHIITILIFALPIPIVGGELLNSYISQRFIDLPIHSTFEAIGGFIALTMSGFLYYRSINSPELYRKYIWVITALSTMGIFDLFHAALSPGNNFVWLHSIAVFSGGLFFSLIWVSRLKNIFIPKSLFQYMIFISIVISIYSIYFPNNIPLMLNEDGTFTSIAKFLNFGGGLLFVLATLFFTLEYKKSKHEQELLFVGHTLLFGIAGLLFNTSVLFDAGWWFWHVLRLTAYMFAQYFIVSIFLYEVKAHNKAKKELVKVNSNLNNEISFALNKQQAQQSLDAKQSKINSLSAMISMVSNQWIGPLEKIKQILEKRKRKEDIQETKEINIEIENLKLIINEFRRFHSLSKEKQSLRDALEASLDIVSSLVLKNQINIVTHYKCLSASKIYGSELTQVFLYIFQYINQKLTDADVKNPIVEITISEKRNKQQQVIITDNFSSSNERELLNQLIDYKSPIKLANELLLQHCNGDLITNSTDKKSKYIIHLKTI